MKAILAACLLLAGCGMPFETWEPLTAQANTLPDSRATALSLESQAMGISMTHYVYVPPNSRGPLPVLYLLRGEAHEWLNPHQDHHRGGRNAIDVYESLRRSGQVGDMVLVFPEMSMPGGRVHSILTNLRSPELAPELGTGRFADMFYDELLPEVERRFPVRKGAAFRAIDGFSLGGFMAVKAAGEHPELFSSVGSYDGTFFIPQDREHVSREDGVVGVGFFDAVLGKPRDWAYVDRNSPVHLVLRQPASAIRKLQWLIQYAPPESEPLEGNYNRGKALEKALKLKGVENPLGIFEDGHHTWWHADEHLLRTLPWHWRRVSQGR